VVHCQHGVRSHHAGELLSREGYTHCVSLEGGLAALRNV
jgi:rhodanese-related sulfurtransferase